MQGFRHYRGQGPPRFAHDSEAEIARLLDDAGIPWEYEPTTFTLEEEGGRVVEAFTPDFYLPEADLYVECTAMRQKLVSRKNRKVRKLRDQGEVVTILYRSDIERLVERYGRNAAA